MVREGDGGQMVAQGDDSRTVIHVPAQNEEGGQVRASVSRRPLVRDLGNAHETPTRGQLCFPFHDGCIAEEYYPGSPHERPDGVR